MVKCIFCGKEQESFKGMHLIKNDGSVSYFCSSKCRKNNLKLKRDRKRFKWTEAYRVAGIGDIKRKEFKLNEEKEHAKREEEKTKKSKN